MRDIRRFYINGKNPYKSPTKLIDSHHPDVKASAEYLVRHSSHNEERIEKILDYVQHEVPYSFSNKSLEYSASKVLYKKKGDFVQRLMLACAMLRAADIGCRIYFTEGNHPLLDAVNGLAPSMILSGYLEIYDEGKWVKSDRFLLPENLSAHLLKKPMAVRPYNGKSELIWVRENTENLRQFGILTDVSELQKMLSSDHLKQYQFGWMQLRKINKAYEALISQLKIPS